jgi:hypothetical protein
MNERKKERRSPKKACNKILLNFVFWVLKAPNKMTSNSTTTTTTTTTINARSQGNQLGRVVAWPKQQQQQQHNKNKNKMVTLD